LRPPGVILGNVDQKFQPTGQRGWRDAKWLGRAILIEGAQRNEALFSGVAEQGLSEDFNLAAIRFEQHVAPNAIEIVVMKES
jgi:hypothetical protein